MRPQERRPPLRFVPSGHLNGLADLAPAGKIPCIREVPALLWFHGLDGALILLEEKTGSIFPINQGQTSPIRTEAGVFLNKGPLFHANMGGD